MSGKNELKNVNRKMFPLARDARLVLLTDKTHFLLPVCQCQKGINHTTPLPGLRKIMTLFSEAKCKEKRHSADKSAMAAQRERASENVAAR